MKNIKRGFAVFMALMMVLSLIPVAAFAAEDEYDGAEDAEAVVEEVVVEEVDDADEAEEAEEEPAADVPVDDIEDIEDIEAVDEVDETEAADDVEEVDETDTEAEEPEEDEDVEIIFGVIISVGNIADEVSRGPATEKKTNTLYVVYKDIISGGQIDYAIGTKPSNFEDLWYAECDPSSLVNTADREGYTFVGYGDRNDPNPEGCYINKVDDTASASVDIWYKPIAKFGEKMNTKEAGSVFVTTNFPTTQTIPETFGIEYSIVATMVDMDGNELESSIDFPYISGTLTLMDTDYYTISEAETEDAVRTITWSIPSIPAELAWYQSTTTTSNTVRQTVTINEIGCTGNGQSCMIVAAEHGDITGSNKVTGWILHTDVKERPLNIVVENTFEDAVAVTWTLKQDDEVVKTTTKYIPKSAFETYDDADDRPDWDEDGYSEIEWTSDKTEDAINFTGTRTANTYSVSVTYKDFDTGETLDEAEFEVKFGSEYDFSSDITGYSLKVGETATGTYNTPNDQEIEILYVRNEYTITFTNGEDVMRKTVVYGDTISEVELPTDPTPAEGQRFVAWVKADETHIEFDATAPITASADYIALFAKQITVTFINGDVAEEDEGRIIAEITIDEGSSPEFPEVTPAEGREFEMWQDSIDEDGNLAYTAIFKDYVPPYIPPSGGGETGGGSTGGNTGGGTGGGSTGGSTGGGSTGGGTGGGSTGGSTGGGSTGGSTGGGSTGGEANEDEQTAEQLGGEEEIFDLGEDEQTALADKPFPFKDVLSSDWYYNEIYNIWNKGLMNGVEVDEFAPFGAVSRGMLVSILYRLENEPEVDSTDSFDDVVEGMYYTVAIAWASANEIILGYGDGTFGPDDPIERQQMAAVLYRYANYKGYDTTATDDLEAFEDVEDIEAYALDAMKWAVGDGIIKGATTTTLEPTATAERGQFAVMMDRFLKVVEAQAETETEAVEETEQAEETEQTEETETENTEAAENESEAE